MKKLIFAMMMLLPMAVVAQEETAEQPLPSILVVHLTNGTTQEYELQEWPEISFAGMDMVIKCGTTTAIITRDEIARYEFADPTFQSVETVTGDKNVVRRGNDVYISNVAAGTPVTVYTVEGREVMSTRANDRGEARVSIDALGKGIYLLTVNNFTTKLIKQ